MTWDLVIFFGRNAKLLTHQTKQPHRQRREQNGIDPVEDTAVTWDNIAAVLNAGLALEEGFDEVAHQTENFRQQGDDDPLPQFQTGRLEERDIGKPNGQPDRDHAAAKEAFPRLARRDARG